MSEQLEQFGSVVFGDTSDVTENKPGEGALNSSSEVTAVSGNKNENINASASTEEKKIIEDALVVQFDENKFLKDKFNYDNADLLKQELDQVKSIKENPLSAVKWENEVSRNIFEYIHQGKEDELFDHLKTKRELATVADLPSEEAIKLNIRHLNKHFSEKDVIDVYNESYRLPRTPVIKEDELEEDFKIRTEEWQEESDRIKRKIERDGFSAKEQLKQKIDKVVLPNILPEVKNSPEQAQQELEKRENYNKSFIESVEKNYKNFNGFKTSFKDGDVDFQVSVEATEEDRTQSKQDVIDDFVNNNFLAQRWFDSDGKPNVTLMQEDLFLLRNRDRILQSFANNGAMTFKEHFLKTKKNVTDFKGGQGSNGNENVSNPMTLLQEAVFN